MDSQSFKQRIKEKFPDLSTGQKKVANYLIEHLNQAAFKTAFQIGRQAAVSETTVIRLSYALGFESFSEMQAVIQEELLRENQAAISEHTIMQIGSSDPFKRVILNEIQILKQLINRRNVQEIWKAVDALIKADQVLIAGHMLSHAAAYWFSYMLGSIRDHVDLCSPTGDFIEKLSNLTKDSVAVVFSFSRYSTQTMKMAEYVSENGICLITVTDRMLSPVGRISDIVLTTEENVQTGSNSIASVISLVDLIIEGIHEKDTERIRAHQQKLEEMYSSFNVFSE
ncbi:MurR/RpiR family transcriptional regulator [Neobacillus rhizophilus]|uniref:MurR/RpiR family transcriptional regulator n=1 Tax=Neobacillus rhizophilus TaxID=2833579 RepID=A0A942U6E9_9BACI|nr:MurR/RpiR family transcriptional regulator [Neobacillus rhizophilus]MBS4212344.1 MurR/RpiR family transcriptional regulator [Neobacillus rhizophilus]MBU8915776.1 MurR/RpiR family transcriptional regulator [Bacillus sp. FJAT-29953]